VLKISAPEDLSTPHLIAGTLQPPVRSSASKGWHGLVVETYNGWRGHMIASYPFHRVSLQLRGRRSIAQCRNGRTVKQVTRAGTIIVTPKGPEKEWTNGEQSDCEFVAVNLSPSLFDRMLDEQEVPHAASVELLDNFGTRDVQLEALAMRLLEEFRTGEFANGMYVEALASQMVIQLLRDYSTLPHLSAPRVRKLSRSRLARTTEFIDDNLCRDLTVAAIASALSMSASHFARAFKQSTGLSPHHYVLERRIEKARSLLRDTDRAVADIAAQVGFSAASHFSVAFSRYVGVSPREYRRRA